MAGFMNSTKAHCGKCHFADRGPFSRGEAMAIPAADHLLHDDPAAETLAGFCLSANPFPPMTGPYRHRQPDQSWSAFPRFSRVGMDVML